MTDTIATLVVGCFGVCIIVLGADALVPTVRRWYEDRRARRWEARRFAQMAEVIRRRDV